MLGAHEWCFYTWREGAAHVFLGPNNVTDLWRVKKVNPQSMVHLTEKPVELAVRAMQCSSRAGENVLDFFGGSGSTLIAARGRPYQHRCPLASFEQVTHAIDEVGDEGFTLETLVEREGPPFTQVAVALALLKERGIIETRYRRNYPATGCVHLDAMTEYWALAENG